MRILIGRMVHDFRCCWKQLVLADIIYKVVAFILLTPLMAILFRVLLAASGKTVLADQDILFFFLAPLGWLCLITVGALWLAILALELAALMAILATHAQRRVGLWGGLRFTAANAWPVIRVTGRIVVLSLLTATSFLFVAAIVYFALLTEYDINYYLQQKPPVFWVVLGIGGALVVSLLAVLLRLFTGWFYALPLVLFEEVRPSQALRLSRERAHGQRRSLLLWILGWVLTTTILSGLATTIVIGLARTFVPRATGSLGLLTFAIGVSVFLWTVVNLAVNLLSTTTFAAMHFNLYRFLGSKGRIDTSRIRETTRDVSGFRLTRGRLLAAGMIGVLIAIVTGLYAVQSVRLEDNVEIMAHRGSSKAAPENTMAAINQAIEDRADWVEIDVQETADGEVVVFHDSDFMKLSGVNLKIWDATLADLKDIDIGSWFDEKFNNERVPTLADVLRACRGKIGVNIELKYYGHDQQLEQRVAEIVEVHEMASNVVVMSLKVDAVKKMKSLRPDWKVGLLMSVSAGDLQALTVDFLAVNAAFANRMFIESAHDSGKEVCVWTVNDAVTICTMVGRGVDGLITDKPAMARSVLQQRAQMSVPERLLVELAGILGVVPEIGEQ